MIPKSIVKVEKEEKPGRVTYTASVTFKAQHQVMVMPGSTVPEGAVERTVSEMLEYAVYGDCQEALIELEATIVSYMGGIAKGLEEIPGAGEPVIKALKKIEEKVQILRTAMSIEKGD